MEGCACCFNVPVPGYLTTRWGACLFTLAAHHWRKAGKTIPLSICQRIKLQSCRGFGVGGWFHISHSQIMHCHPLWIQSIWNSWAAPRDKKIVFALSGTPFQQGAHPDCKCTRGEKRNRTQSLKSLSRHWLIHIWKSDSAFHANKKLLRGRINTKQGVWVFRSEGSQLADKSWSKQSDIQLAEDEKLWPLGIFLCLAPPCHFCEAFFH